MLKPLVVVTFPVSNLKAAIVLYGKLLNLVHVPVSHDAVYFDCGDFRLELVQTAKTEHKHDGAGNIQVHTDDIEADFERWTDLGLTPPEHIDRSSLYSTMGHTEIQFIDRDGNIVVLSGSGRLSSQNRNSG